MSPTYSQCQKENTANCDLARSGPRVFWFEKFANGASKSLKLQIQNILSGT